MKLSGNSELPGTPDEVFHLLFDRELLLRCIPGCERLEEVSPLQYAVTVKAGVGAVKGNFKGEVQVNDVVEPERYAMSIKGKSAVGHAQGSAQVRLEAVPAGTRIVYEGEAKVSGMIAAVGGRLIQVAAKKVAQDFFDKLAAEIASRSS